jgi:hypothetical protein
MGQKLIEMGLSSAIEKEEIKQRHMRKTNGEKIFCMAIDHFILKE